MMMLLGIDKMTHKYNKAKVIYLKGLAGLVFIVLMGAFSPLGFENVFMFIVIPIFLTILNIRNLNREYGESK